MANETNKTVTISADYFVKLHQMATQSEMSVETINTIKKERDELKANLVYSEREAEKCKGIPTEYRRCRDRLAAAERCIDDIEKLIDITDEAENTIGKIIRAWRENKEREMIRPATEDEMERGEAKARRDCLEENGLSESEYSLEDYWREI